MPTYDYLCDSCGHEMEAFQRFSEDPLEDCPACSAPKLRRQFGTGGGILFKGSGFYETDYRSESYKSGAQKEQSPKSDSAAKGDKSGKSGDCSGNPSACPACD